MEVPLSLSTTHLCVSPKAKYSAFSAFLLTQASHPLCGVNLCEDDPLSHICGSNLDLVPHVQSSITHFHMCIMHTDTHSWLKSVCYSQSLGRRGVLPSSLPPFLPWHLVPLVQSRNYLWFLFLLLPATHWIIHQIFKNFSGICHLFSIHHYPLV